MSHIPVIIGVGQSIHRDDDDWMGAEPLRLIVDAARHAVADAGTVPITEIDSVDILHVQAWRYDDLPGLVGARLGCDATRGTSYPVGGETPLRVLDDVARRIQRGETKCALIAGAE